MQSLKNKYSDLPRECGVDEVGRGCCAGPVVAAAVILPDGFYHKKLKDSKKMTEKSRVEVAEYVKEHAVAYAVAEVTADEIDRINILNASILAMHKALDCIDDVNFILADGNQFKPYKKVQHLCVIKGDATYASIAAASVIAKVYRDDLMRKLSDEFPNYNWANNKGYITKDHLVAIRDHGYTKYHRKSYSLQLPPLNVNQLF